MSIDILYNSSNDDLSIIGDLSVNFSVLSNGGGNNLSGFTGEIRIWTNNNPPQGWLLCDGNLYLRSNYTDLSNIIGTTFGGNDISFNVPDLRRRTVIGHQGNNSTNMTTRDLSGSNLYDVSGNQSLFITEIPSHNHNTSPTTHTHTLGNHNHDICYNHIHDNISEHVHNIQISEHTHNAEHSHQVTHNHTADTHKHNIELSQNYLKDNAEFELRKSEFNTDNMAEGGNAEGSLINGTQNKFKQLLQQLNTKSPKLSGGGNTQNSSISLLGVSNTNITNVEEEINPSIITHEANTDSINIQVPGENFEDLLQVNNNSLITTDSTSNIISNFVNSLQLNQHFPYIIVNYIIKT